MPKKFSINDILSETRQANRVPPIPQLQLSLKNSAATVSNEIFPSIFENQRNINSDIQYASSMASPSQPFPTGMGDFYQTQIAPHPALVPPYAPFFGLNAFAPYFAGGLFAPLAMLPNLTGAKRKRRHRTIFSEEQIELLECAFNLSQYPDMSTRERLARDCDLKEERVEVWFKNRRAKNRKLTRTNGENDVITSPNVSQASSDGNSKELSEEEDEEERENHVRDYAGGESSPRRNVKLTDDRKSSVDASTGAATKMAHPLAGSSTSTRKRQLGDAAKASIDESKSAPKCSRQEVSKPQNDQSVPLKISTSISELNRETSTALLGPAQRLLSRSKWEDQSPTDGGSDDKRTTY